MYCASHVLCISCTAHDSHFPSSRARSAGKYEGYVTLQTTIVGFSVSSAPVSSVKLPTFPNQVIDFAYSTDIGSSPTTMQQYVASFVNGATVQQVQSMLGSYSAGSSMASLNVLRANASSSVYAFGGWTVNLFVVGQNGAANGNWAVFEFPSYLNGCALPRVLKPPPTQPSKRGP